MHTSQQFLSLRRLVSLGVAIAPVLLAACAHQGATQSGFLNDYDKLATSQKDPRAMVYARIAPSTAASALRIVVIDPVQSRLPAEQATDLSPELLSQAQTDYRVALEKAFSKNYLVVAQMPAAGGLRVRAAITGLKPSNPTLNAITLLLVGPVSNGGVSTESEVVDSATGERVAAQTTFTNGHLFKGGLGGYFDKLGHIRKAFDSHAEKLRDLTITESARVAASTEQASAR